MLMEDTTENARKTLRDILHKAIEKHIRQVFSLRVRIENNCAMHFNVYP